MQRYNQSTALQALANQPYASLDATFVQDVQAILQAVKTRGDEALIDFTQRFDGVRLTSLQVSEAIIKKAFLNTSPKVIKALQQAIENIKYYHQHQTMRPFAYERNGRLIGQQVTPIQRVGVYIPGGTAVYPSTVLMNVIPAQIAGVPSISLASPVQRNGEIHPTILAACYLLGIREVYRVGGAQAIAAFTYGTQSIPRVDKIVGPGNRYVAMAKRLVLGQVGIDTIAGPSEVCILADESANPEYVAADLIAQAEHDRFARSICIATSSTLINQIEQAIHTQLLTLSRADIAKASLDNFGMLIHVDSLDQGIDLVNTIAPEHLEIQTKNPRDLLPRILHAGSIFLGAYTPEPVGDYFAGPNHTLPTSGYARFASGLSTYDFLKRSAYVEYSQQALQEDADAIMTLAKEETLTAHAESVKKRL